LATYRLVSNNDAALLMLDDLHRRVMLDSGGGAVRVAEVNSFEPTFCGHSAEISVLRNPLILNVSTAASAPSCVG
jgi:hypothetical protein